MGQITVKFSGICTHIRDAIFDDAVSPATMPPHRVVLVHGESGAYFEAQQQSVPPHMPLLRIDPRSLLQPLPYIPGLQLQIPGAWLLQGVRLRVANAVSDQPLRYDSTWDEIMPSLTFYAGMSNPPLTLDAEVVTGEIAACYFDVDCGDFTTKYIDANDYAAKAVLTVQTDGPPQLEITRFFDQRRTLLPLPDDIAIVVENVGETKDTDWDFLLHYLVAQTIPPTATPPPVRDVPSGIGAGCSNSSYP